MDNFTTIDWILFCAMILFFLCGVITMAIGIIRFIRVNKQVDAAISESDFDKSRKLNDRNFANVLLVFGGLGLTFLGWLIPNLVIALR